MRSKLQERPKSPSSPSFIRQVWLNIVLLGFAAASAAVGALLLANPDWARRPDVAEYNEGVAAWDVAPALRGITTLERATAHLETALNQTRSDQVRALAAYNLGAIKGSLALADIRSIKERYATTKMPGVDQDENLTIARQELRKAIQNLAQAARLDPSLDDAKYNLELFETEQGEPPVPGTRYSPGKVDKGY
jgi:polygalacturonase